MKNNKKTQLGKSVEIYIFYGKLFFLAMIGIVGLLIIGSFMMNGSFPYEDKDNLFKMLGIGIFPLLSGLMLRYMVAALSGVGIEATHENNEEEETKNGTK